MIQPDPNPTDAPSSTDLHPDATEVDHLVDPNDPESRAEWLTYMTGSKVASVLGISPFTTRLELWRQMTGRDGPDEDNPYMAHGREREPIVREASAAELGCVIRRTGFLVSNANPRHAYSPDGIVCPASLEPNGLWECKTATEKSAAKWAFGIPDFYDVQWQWGAYVTGLLRGMFTLETHEDFVPISTADYPITRNDERIEQLIDAVDDFLTYVDSDTPPPPLGAVVVTDPDDVDTIRRWAKDNAQRLDVEKQIKAARPLIDRLGENAQALVTPEGDVLCHWVGGEGKDVDTTDWAAVESQLTDAQRLMASKAVIDHALLAEAVPDLVREHTTTETITTTRSLRQGARK